MSSLPAKCRVADISPTGAPGKDELSLLRPPAARPRPEAAPVRLAGDAGLANVGATKGEVTRDLGERLRSQVPSRASSRHGRALDRPRFRFAGNRPRRRERRNGPSWCGGSARPRACSIGLEPVASTRADCRSPAEQASSMVSGPRYRIWGTASPRLDHEVSAALLRSDAEPEVRRAVVP